MKKLMVAIAAAAISFAGFADDTNNWFTAGFGAEALSSGGAWSPDASSLTWGDENVLLLEDVEAAAPVVFAADEAKAGASTNDDTTVVFDTTVTFQGFDELPAIDANAKAGVCALTDGNYYVVAYDDVGSTNKWVDTGIDAAFDVAVNVKVTVANGKAVYTFTDQFGTNGTDPLDLVDAEFQEVCYSGNGSVSTLAADTILAGVAITLPVIDGLTVTCDKARAAVGETVLLKFAADTKFPNRTEALYEVKANGELEFADDGDEPAGQDPGAMIEDAIYRDFEDAYTNAVVGNTIVLCSAQTFGGVSSVEKKVSVDINGFRFEIGNDLEVSSALTITDSKLEEAAGLLVLGAVVNLGEIGTLDISEVLWENVKDVGYVTGYGAELDIAVSPNMMFAKGALGAERPDMLIKCDDVEYYLDSDAEIETRYVNEFEVAYGTVVAGDLEYEETFDSVQAAIDATDEVYLSLYAGELPEDETELTFKPSTVVYAATGADDLDGVDLLPVGEVEFDESLGEFGGWKIPGEPPAPETITLSWTEDNDKMGTVVYIDENPVDNGAAVNTGDMAEFIVLPKTGYAYSTAPDGWELTPEGGITKTVEVEYASISVEIPEPTEIPVPTKQIQLPATTAGVAGYIVSNVTDNIDIQADVLEEPVAIGKTYTLPLGKKVEIWVVPADDYLVTGNPYTIDVVTSETTVEITDLPVVKAAVAKIDSDLYLTLQEAINAAQAGATVTLLANVSEKITIAAGKDLTLDLNEKTLTGTDANYVINNLGTVVITGDGVVDSAVVSHNTLVRNGETGVMTIESGTFKSARITVKNDENGKGVCGVLTINGGTFLASSEVGAEVWDSVQNWGIATINGGEFNGYIECRAESNWNAGEMTINGGTFQKPVQTVVVFDNTKTPADNAADVALTINGGTFNDMVMRVADVKAKAGEAANVRVDFDATMPEYVASCETLGTVTIPGKVDEALNPAQFASDESVYCEKGFETKLDGGRYVVAQQFMFFIGEIGYADWETMYTAARDGDIIKVGAGAELKQPSGSIGKTLTIDLDGNTLTFVQGWLTGDVKIVDNGGTPGEGLFTMTAYSMNVGYGKLDLSALASDQVSGLFQMNDSSVVKFPSDRPFEECKSAISQKGDGSQIVVQGVTYRYNADQDRWIPEGCYDLIIIAPENGTLETSATNAVPAGTVVMVMATPDDGYQLVSITTNGEAIVGTEFVMPEEVVTVAATFESAAVTIDFANAAVEGLGATFEPAVTSALPGTEITATYTNETKIATGATTTVYVVQPDGTLAVKEGSEKPEAKDPAAKIGTVLYLTLQDAVNEGGEVVMLADCTEMVVVPAGVEVTLDFNGFKIDVNGWAIKNCGTLTIANGNVNAREAAITMYGDSVTTISGGTFTSTDNAVIMGQGSEQNGNVKLTITGGEFNGCIVTSGYIACGVYAANSGVYTIDGGTFNIVNGCGVCARAGQITIGEEVVFNVSGEIEGKVGDKNVAIPCVDLYVDRTEPPYPGYDATTDYLKAEANTFKIDEQQFWVAEEDSMYSLHDVSEAVATVNGEYYLTVESAFAAVQAAEAVQNFPIVVKALAEDGLTITDADRTASIAKDVTITITKGTWSVDNVLTYSGAIEGTVIATDILIPDGGSIKLGVNALVTVGLGSELSEKSFTPPEGNYEVKVMATDESKTFKVVETEAWDIPGAEGGINALVKGDGTKYVEFTEITLTATGATVGLHAKEIDANGQTFGLVCKTDLTKDETIVINATLSYEQGALGIPTQGTFTITAEALSGYDQLFVVGVGPAAK